MDSLGRGAGGESGYVVRGSADGATRLCPAQDACGGRADDGFLCKKTEVRSMQSRQDLFPIGK